jgi:hypothetical protein
MEPEAAEMFEQARKEWGALGRPVPPHTMEQIIGLSQAASLKRIADALWGTADTAGIIELLNGVEAASRRAA